MALYASPRLYFQSATDLYDKICRIQAVQLALEDAMLTAASGQDTEEYLLDDGQTKIRNTYRSIADMSKSYEGLERILQMYVNRYNGHVVHLVDYQSNRLQ